METVTEPSWDPHGDLHGILAGTFMESCHEGFSNLHGTFIGSFMETFCGPSWDLRENVQNRSKLNLSLPFVQQNQEVKGRLDLFSMKVPTVWNLHGKPTATFMEFSWELAWDLHGTCVQTFMETRKEPSWKLHDNLHGNVPMTVS